MPADHEVKYLVLADRAVPYLLARVRWPDVAQAISAASPGWLDDSGLFDLPYNPSAVTVSFTQAASVAAGWGRQLHAEPAEGVPSSGECQQTGPTCRLPSGATGASSSSEDGAPRSIESAGGSRSRWRPLPPLTRRRAGR